MAATVNALALATPVTLLAASSNSSTIAGNAVDLAGYEGVILVEQNLGTGTTITNPRLQHSANGSTNWEDISGATFGTTASTITTVALDERSVRRYIRYAATIATGPVLLGVTMLAFKKVSA